MYKKSLKKFDSELAQKQNKRAQFEELSEKELDEVVGARDTVQIFKGNEMAAMMSCISSYNSTFSGPVEAYVPPCMLISSISFEDDFRNSSSFIWGG